MGAPHPSGVMGGSGCPESREVTGRRQRARSGEGGWIIRPESPDPFFHGQQVPFGGYPHTHTRVRGRGGNGRRVTAVPTARRRELRDPAPKNQTPQCRRVTQTEATGVSREEFPPGLHGVGGLRAAALRPAGTVVAGGALPENSRYPASTAQLPLKPWGQRGRASPLRKKEQSGGPEWAPAGGEGTRELSCCHRVAPSPHGAAGAPWP